MTTTQEPVAVTPLAEADGALTTNVAPSAFGDDFRRFVNLTYTLAATEFKLRYFGSFLGYLWSLIRPLLFFGVLYEVFTRVFHAGAGIKGYPVYLLTSIVMWTFFVEATAGCVQCLVFREGLLRKMRFPRLVIPLAVCLTALFNFCTNFVAVLVFATIAGITPTIAWLEMPLLVVLWATLAVGVGMLLSVLFVRFRDIQPIWEVITQIMFYGSPIIYVITKYPAALQRPVMISPVAAILTQMRHVFVDPTAPSAAAVIGGAFRLAIPLGIIGGLLALGLWFFSREAPRIAEHL
jgi:ABC-2 type transport system permease protein